MIIYQAKNLINEKLYIGKTKGSLANRQRGHIRSALMKDSKTVFHNAIRKYGQNNFEFSILEELASDCSDDLLNEKERFWIVQMNSKIPSGYNMTDGGDGNDGSIKPNLGIPMSDEQKEKLRKANLGNKHSKETKIKMSISQKLSYEDSNRGTIKGKPSKKKGKPSGYFAWNKGLDGFCKGKTAWNKGLTKEDHPSIASQSEKMKEKTAWNKGLTKETDERVKQYSKNLIESENSNIFKLGHEPWNKGLHIVHSEESNQKRSETMKNKSKSPETIKNMKVAQQRRREKEKSLKEVA